MMTGGRRSREAGMVRVGRSRRRWRKEDAAWVVRGEQMYRFGDAMAVCGGGVVMIGFEVFVLFMFFCSSLNFAEATAGGLVEVMGNL
jgi:hypothetical protein